MVHSYSDNHEATATCVYAYCANPGEEPLLFRGDVQGRIVSPRGKHAFGWDPIFQPRGYTQTYAELDPDVKNSISHRSQALSQLRLYLEHKLK